MSEFQFFRIDYLEALVQLGERLKSWLLQEGRVQPEGLNRFHLIHTFIHQHHTQPIRMIELAKRLHVSPSRATHIVKEETGESFSELLAKARVKTASHLLKHTDEGLAQVVLMSGFPDLSLFHQAFKKAMGQTPGQFRKSPPSSP